MRLERVDGEIGVLRLAGGKANAIGEAFLHGLDRCLDEVEAEPPGALVIAADAAASGGAFSAGLDLPSLIGRDRPAMRAFIGGFERVMQRVFELPLPVVAAVSGHAIAGGCVLALQADVRILADVDKLKIGLNEVAIGIGLPPVVLETLRAQVPAASLVPLALEGRLVGPREALALGLAHELAPADALEARAIERARAMIPPNAIAYAQVKRALRAPVVAAAAATEGGVEPWLDSWCSPAGHEALSAVVAKLRKR